MAKSKNSLTWTCVACEKEMSHKEFLEHAQTIHKVDIKKPATSKLMAHMDGRDWFSSTYEIVTENGIKFMKNVVCARAKDDIMRYV